MLALHPLQKETSGGLFSCTWGAQAAGTWLRNTCFGHNKLLAPAAKPAKKWPSVAMSTARIATSGSSGQIVPQRREIEGWVINLLVSLEAGCQLRPSVPGTGGTEQLRRGRVGPGPLLRQIHGLSWLAAALRKLEKDTGSLRGGCVSRGGAGRLCRL